MSSKTINILRILFRLYSSIFSKISYHFEYSIKALESLKCFMPAPAILLIKNWYFVTYGSLAF